MAFWEGISDSRCQKGSRGKRGANDIDAMRCDAMERMDGWRDPKIHKKPICFLFFFFFGNTVMRFSLLVRGWGKEDVFLFPGFFEEGRMRSVRNSW